MSVLIQGKEKIQNQISDLLCANGFYEIMNNSLTNVDYNNELESINSNENVNILIFQIIYIFKQYWQ